MAVFPSPFIAKEYRLLLWRDALLFCEDEISAVLRISVDESVLDG
jgi:hypothetical protein